MKYCFACGRITSGEPLYCSYCGRTYDVKLCPARHPNPRYAEVCSKCGSRDLSTPQPRISFLWKFVAILLRIALGLIAIAIVLAVLLGTLQGLLTSPRMQEAALVLGILAGLLWWAWHALPDGVKKLARWAWKQRRGRDESH